MTSYVLRISEVNKSMVSMVGGKAANLGELAGIRGIDVPDGFCLSTEAFERAVGGAPAFNTLVNKLKLLKSDNLKEISRLGSQVRSVIHDLIIPDEIRSEVANNLARLGEKEAYAVRSSATAEDLPGASFAGQQDTYLNIIGLDSVLLHIRSCWASLFTDRAIIYRNQHGFEHHKVHLCVVVQKMVFPEAAGTLFTADPITSNRKILSIDASFGLGESVVSGLVNADIYKVSGGKIINKRVSAKMLGIFAAKDGGTQKQAIKLEEQNSQVITDDQILCLESVGRKIENHFGFPQDIEWCLADNSFHIVQSRPITTLYPVPEVDDTDNHVYVSVGHQQMMCDAMRPLGLSFFLLTTQAPMQTAGGRLFVDVTTQLASPDGQNQIIEALGASDPLIKDALETIIQREGFIRLSQASTSQATQSGLNKPSLQPPLDAGPAITRDLMRQSQTTVNELRKTIESISGPELFDFILQDIQHLQKSMFGPESMAVIMAAMNAATWINENANAWLGEKNVADTLSQSVADNVTSEMGLALLDVADVIRPYPQVVNHLQHIGNDDALEGLRELEGGAIAREAIFAYLQKYGMRCAGEIDITKTRWGEKPAILASLILGNIKNFSPGAAFRKFEEGRRDALAKQRDLLNRFQSLPDGEKRAAEAKGMIDAIRAFTGFREYPKYKMVSHYFIYKQALLKEAEKLVQQTLIHEKEDIYYLDFEELRQVVATQKLDYQIIRERKEEFRRYEKLSPPRVITSDGEIITGAYKREDLPAGAVAGLAVSSGVIEGRARVILSMEDAVIEKGDILVTSFTDPGWTTLFVSIAGLITEVGGVMTHGAVIAREYGLPAVVGVEGATKLIKDGQRIRVNGTDGYVEFL